MPALSFHATQQRGFVHPSFCGATAEMFQIAFPFPFHTMRLCRWLGPHLILLIFPILNQRKFTWLFALGGGGFLVYELMHPDKANRTAKMKNEWAHLAG